jgi:2-succinyl-5-enolpyruvyl-6-hydroxy-3-cyclohexene-1-carboxylate synthase
VPGIIVLGVGDTNVRVNEVAEIWSLPVVADVTSGARFRGCPTVIAAYEYMPLELLPEPSVIIQFGAAPTSKRLTNYLNGIDSAFRVLVSNDGVWQDDMHHTDLFVQADPDAFCRALSQGVEREPKPVPRPFAVMDYAAWDLIDKEIDETFFDGAVYRRIARRISDINNLFLGNSSPVRAMDQYGKAVDAFTDVYASRGASGIDGQVSTALGIGVATGEHVYAILGDITFYHDMNGLLAIKRNNVSATFIVINNNGGGIFERLPIREFEPYHTEYFLTPHGLTFEHAAAMYGLEYAVADDFASLDRALDQYMKPGVSAIIEVKTNIKTDEARRQEIMRLVQEELRRQFGNKDNHEPLV